MMLSEMYDFFCLERRLRERNMRQLGKRQNRDQLPFELLRESASANGRGRGIDSFSQRRAERESARRQTPLHEEEDPSRMAKFVGRVKGLASGGKTALASKYQSAKVAFGRRADNDDDVVELLSVGGGTGGSSSSSSAASSISGTITRPNGAGGSGLGHRQPREPPKDIFEGI